MAAVLQVTVAERGGDSPKRLPINGVARSERIGAGARGELSAEFDTATLRTNGLLDCRGYEISQEHGELSTWAGVIQQVSHDLATGTTEIAAQSKEAYLDARRTAKTYQVADGDAGAIAQKVIADAAKGGSMFIVGYRVQPTGLVDINLRSEQVVDAIDELSRLADAEWRITPEGYFEFAKRIGQEKSTVVLAEGKNIDANAQFILDLGPVINDLAVMSAVSEYTRRTAVVVRDDTSIEAIGQRQDTLVKDYMVKESALRPAGKAELAKRLRLGRAATFDVLNVNHVWSAFSVGDTVRLLVPSCGIDHYFRVMARSWDSDSNRMTVSGEWGGGAAMTRKWPARLVDPQSAHYNETLRILGVPSGKDRSIADARARLAEPGSDKPKVVTGNIDDGTVFNDLLNVLQARNIITNKTERGGKYGEQSHNATLVNANSPVFLVQAEGSADTASTTNTVTTVSAITMAIDLDVGKWAVSAMGSVILTHSTGATVAVSVEIDSDEGTARTVTSAAAPGVRAFAHLNRVDEVNWIQGEQTINIRVRYRSDTSGTTSAKNPQVMALARRME